MEKGKIVVNNEVVKKHVKPPKNGDTLKLNKVELEEIQAAKLVKGGEHIEKGSEFTAYAVRVSKKEDVKKAYMKLRIKYEDATHITCAYRLAKPNGPYGQEQIDDGDYGCARTILETMKEHEVKEMAIFLLRCYSGVHLGDRRFEIFEQMASKAITAMFRYKAKRRGRSERINSQSSLASLASHLSESEAEVEFRNQNTEDEN